MNYKFHREELLIYMLIKMKDGLRHTVMADKIVGGDSRRWSAGYNFIVHHIDKRYEHLIGPNGLRRWVTQFPMFAEKIREAIGRERRHVDENGNVVEVEAGVDFVPGGFCVR